SAEHNDFQAFYSIGLVQNDTFLSGDKLGLAVAIAETSSEKRRIDPLADRRETAIELTYSVAVTDHIHIQPDIQYIIAPGTESYRRQNALAFGLRTVFRLAPE
ncbi:carbohydrate porin, partial [Hyphococcus lacteus]